MTTERDERLAAWLDSALPPDEAEAFAAEVASNPELAAQAEAWRTHDHHITAAFGGAERLIDDALLARLGLAAAPAPANDNPRWLGLRWLAGGSALAAGLAATVLLTMRAPAPTDPLSDVLEHTASLASAQLADGRMITPTLTVRAADGRWCREFRAGTETGLACRASGRWAVEARTRAGAPTDPGAIAVASGADPSPLDAAYGILKPSDPLSAADESRLLANHWQ